MSKKHKSTDEERADEDRASKEKHFRTGFSALSRVLARDEDRFSMVFKRFDRLAAQSLAYMQSELKYLQRKLDDMDNEDQNPEAGEKEEGGEGCLKRCLKSWEHLQREVDKKNKRQLERFSLIMDIRSKLKAYREALLQQADITNLDTPTQKTLDAIKEEIQYGPEDFEELYKDKVYLVSLRSPVFKDNVTSFVDKHMSERFKVCSASPKSRDRTEDTNDGKTNCKKPNGGDDESYYYSFSKMILFVDITCAILAEVAMALPIWGLYAVGRYVPLDYAPWIQLTIMTVSSLLFVTIWGLLMNVERSDLFSAAAGYFAVLVVFLGLNLHTSNQ